MKNIGAWILIGCLVAFVVYYTETHETKFEQTTEKEH